jgi:DUF4097 and DUF4098 domain-containing protein YvlB
MNERRKILSLLQEGKITAEQAETLLGALEEPQNESMHRFHIPPLDKQKWDKTAKDIKTFGTQMSTIVAQALSEAKKEIELQVGDFMSHDSIFRSYDFKLPQDVNSVCVETSNCKIRAVEWDQPIGRISVHGQIRASDLGEAEQAIQGAVVSHSDNGAYRLSVPHNSVTRGVRIASIDVFLPKGTDKLQLKSRNGNLQVDSINTREIELQTQNGHITTSYVNAHLIRITTSNGRIDMFHSIGLETKNVYVASKNGTIAINGVESQNNCVGAVKTIAGQIDIDDTYFDVTFTDTDRKNGASFRNKHLTPEAPTTNILCETSNGKVMIRPV